MARPAASPRDGRPGVRLGRQTLLVLCRISSALQGPAHTGVLHECKKGRNTRRRAAEGALDLI